jgi:hypothetical protein
MVQGIKRSLDGKIIYSKILITIVAKREIKAMKLSSPPNHRNIFKKIGKTNSRNKNTIHFIIF